MQFRINKLKRLVLISKRKREKQSRFQRTALTTF